jgi:PAS domain S-box-containing protein
VTIARLFGPVRRVDRREPALTRHKKVKDLKAYLDDPAAGQDRLQVVENALKESEAKYHRVIEKIEDGYYEVDLAGNFTFFNDAMARITGYLHRELMGMNYRQIMDEYNAKRVYEVFNKVFMTGTAAKAFDWELIRKDGKKVTLEVSVSLRTSSVGEPLGFSGIARDISRRKMMESALRESEEKYRTIIENIEDGYYEVDLAGNFTFFNESLCRMTGFSRDELLGKNYRHIMDEYNAKRVFNVFNTVFITQLSTKAVDWELLRRDSSKRFIEVSVSLRKNLNGEPIGFMGIARDITERKINEQTLIAREEELKAKTTNLEEVNTALKVLLRRREEDRRELEETVMTNLNDLVNPYMERLRKRSHNPKLREIVEVMETNLKTITSPFFHRLSSQIQNLTSAEIEIANLVKQGKSTKEISDLLNVSIKTIETHRLNIRKKLGLSKKKASLRTHLLSIR